MEEKVESLFPVSNDYLSVIYDYNNILTKSNSVIDEKARIGNENSNSCNMLLPKSTVSELCALNTSNFSPLI